MQSSSCPDPEGTAGSAPPGVRIERPFWGDTSHHAGARPLEHGGNVVMTDLSRGDQVRILLAHLVLLGVIALIDGAGDGWSSVDWPRAALIVGTLAATRMLGPRLGLDGGAVLDDDLDVLQSGGRPLLAATPGEAADVARRWILREWKPDWEPAIVRVQDAGRAWLVFYNTKRYLETRIRGDALSGNRPLRVRKAGLADA